MGTFRNALRHRLKQVSRFPTSRLRESRHPEAANADAPVALVIGSGFGGLAAALRLAVRGYRVKLVERLPQLGGRARVHKIDGYTFDAGPTVITAPFLFEELWELAGKRLQDDVDMRPVTPFYQIHFDEGGVFNYTGDAKQMRAEITKFSPNDVRGYESFVEKSKEIFEIGFESLAHVPFSKAKDMLRIVPPMVALESYRSVVGLVSKYVRDERLRQVLSFHPLLVGGNPYSTSSIYTLIAYLERKWGVHFPMGGTGALVNGLEKILREVGAEIHLESEVQEILVEGGTAKGVRLVDGRVLDADVVVSNADAAWTYRHLIRKEHRKAWRDFRIDNSRYSMSLFVWYFGTSKKYDNVEHHTILLGPRYKELLQDIFKKKTLADDFSLYLHRPTATDPSLAPDGHDAFYVLSPVPHLDAGIDWSVEAERYRQKIEAYLEEKLMPGLSKSLTVSRLLTPQGFEDDYLSFKGAAFSFEPVLQQSAYLRPHNKSEDVEGLYFVGAGTHPGAGMPGVLSSARILDTVVPDPGELRQARRAAAS